jgi:hypothetical protein
VENVIPGGMARRYLKTPGRVTPIIIDRESEKVVELAEPTLDPWATW